MSYPPLTFVKLPACSPASSPLRDGSPLLTHSRDAALPSSPLRSTRVETAASSPARNATQPRPTHGAASSASAGEKRRSFWSDLFVNSDSSQDNEDEDEDSDGDLDSGHPLRSSLSLLSAHTTQKRKRAALEQPSQSSRVIASAAPFLTTKRRRLVDTAADDADDDDNRLDLGTTEPKHHAWPRVDKGGVVILDDDDDEEDAFVLQAAVPRHTPPPSPLSERNSNKEGGSGSPWLRRKRDAVAVATVKPTALHPQPAAAANHLISDDADDMEKESESDKENYGGGALADDRRRSQKANQKPQPSVKRVEETVKKPSSAPLANHQPEREMEAEEREMDLEAKGGDDDVTLEAEQPEGSSSTAGAEPPRLKFLSPFTEEEVKKWSKARLQAWKQRHRNANSYYYRFTDPTVAQSERKLSREEHQAFMRRYEEFQRNGWRVGTSWGLFSMALPSRVGYQCANHYRKLLKEGKLNDNSFKLDPKGEVKLVEGADTRGHCGIENALSDVWKTKEVKAIERCVDKWIGEYHEGASKALSFPDDEDDEACKNDDDNEAGELQASSDNRKPKPKSKPGSSMVAKRGRPQPTVASFIAACDEAAPRETIVLDTDEEAFEADHRGAAHSAKKRNAAAEDGGDETERRGHNNESEADGSIDDPVEENMFVYAAQDEDDTGVTTTTTTTTATSSFKRPQSNVWKNFIVGDASEPLHGHRKARATAGRGRALKGKQLDLSHFIPGVKPAPAVVEAEDNKSLIDKTVIPRPIPRSWAKAVQPFDYEAARGQKAIPGSRYVEATIEELELEKLGSFEAILMDPPWDLSPRASASDKARQCHQLVPKRGKNGERLISPEELGKWPVTDKLIPKGFLFIWTEKELIPRVLTMAQKWGFHYVENFAWVKFDVNNKIHTEDYAYFRKSKLTLLMLRKPGDIELRHQRNPDVKFDFVRKGRERLPFVFDIIETLLPTAKYNPKTGKGKMLQLWCLPQERRSGWTSVHLSDESAHDDESPVELEYVESPSSEE